MMASTISFVSSGPMRSVALFRELKVAMSEVAQLAETDGVFLAADGFVVLHDAFDDARLAQIHAAHGRQTEQLVTDRIEVTGPSGIDGLAHVAYRACAVARRWLMFLPQVVKCSVKLLALLSSVFSW